MTDTVQHPAPRPARWALRLLLMALSLVFCLVAIAVGEWACRRFTRITFEGNSHELYAGRRFGPSMGHAPLAHGVSFGHEVWTDVNGFRIDPTFVEPPADKTLLVLGDSVAFGAGVSEAESFAGLIRRGQPPTRVYNSSVIGYALTDYQNVLEHVLPAHPEVREVVLSFCLNDISHQTAVDLDTFFREASDTDTIGRIRSLPHVAELNAFLRTRSKLYLGLKNALTDPSGRTFRNDRELYDVPDARLDELLSPIEAMSTQLASSGVPLLVVIAPEEPQLRMPTGDADLPQRKIASYLAAHHIAYVDPLPTFRRAGDPASLYLSGDAAHFSPEGHRLIFDAIRTALH